MKSFTHAALVALLISSFSISTSFANPQKRVGNADAAVEKRFAGLYRAKTEIISSISRQLTRVSTQNQSDLLIFFGGDIGDQMAVLETAAQAAEMNYAVIDMEEFIQADEMEFKKAVYEVLIDRPQSILIFRNTEAGNDLVQSELGRMIRTGFKVAKGTTGFGGTAVFTPDYPPTVWITTTGARELLLPREKVKGKIGIIPPSDFEIASVLSQKHISTSILGVKPTLVPFSFLTSADYQAALEKNLKRLLVEQGQKHGYIFKAYFNDWIPELIEQSNFLPTNENAERLVRNRLESTIALLLENKRKTLWGLKGKPVMVGTFCQVGMGGNEFPAL